MANAQTGKYIALEHSGMTFESSKKGENTLIGKEKFNEKTLILNKDSTFYFEYEWPNPSVAQITIYKCVGK